MSGPPRNEVLPRLPWWPAVAAAAVAVLVLWWPVSARAGDHEAQRCGNALHLDLSSWKAMRSQGYSDGEYYYQKARRICERARRDRVPWAVGAALTAIALGTASFTVRRRRREVAISRSRWRAAS